MASTIKAAYEQLQMNRSNLIQFSDLAIVSELRRISELEHSYFRNRLVIPCTVPDSSSGLFAQIEKQRNLIKTYRITKTKKESIFGLEASPRKFTLIPRWATTLRRGVAPNHVLTVLQFAINSIRSLVKVLVKQMESAGWDLDAAASAEMARRVWLLHCIFFSLELRQVHLSRQKREPILRGLHGKHGRRNQ
ncbi:uncharacterized protein LOC122001999 [Zingiber officinale]|uniref:uncharacterized protein LOC122001999 n=1 Tax=Zingiber officinale TaxID=94328 RepID=UPI001C4BAD40|nr:uncharacterized protein LOC122001999 [Zingiber officinale]